MIKYTVTKTHKGVKKGTKVYNSNAVGYGLASEDTRFTGKAHVLVNEASPFEDQTYNNFTFPLEYLEVIPETDEYVLNLINNIELKNKENSRKGLEKLIEEISKQNRVIYHMNKIYLMTDDTFKNLITSIENNEELMFEIGRLYIQDRIYLDRTFLYTNKHIHTLFNRHEVVVEVGFNIYGCGHDEDWGGWCLSVDMSPDEIELIDITEDFQHED